MPDAEDFYAELGVPRSASQDEIQRAYRKLARKYHPDVNKDPDAEARFKRISQAYDVLSDPDTRGKYDRYGPDFRRVDETGGAAGGAPGSGAGGWPGGGRSGPGWGGGAAGGDAGGWQVYGDDLGGVDIEDLFGGMFSGRRGGFGGRVPGADQEVEITVSVEDAYHGTKRQLQLSSAEGVKTIDVTVPAGVTDGQRIRLGGQGGAGSGGAPAGDLYLVVRLAPHHRYRVSGRDLTVDLPLTPPEAALGAEVEVLTPGGAVTVKVPHGTSSGGKLRLKGRGLPGRGKNPAGDLFAQASIKVPRHLSDEERDLYERLNQISTFDPRGDRPPRASGSRSSTRKERS